MPPKRKAPPRKYRRKAAVTRKRQGPKRGKPEVKTVTSSGTQNCGSSVNSGDILAGNSSSPGNIIEWGVAPQIATSSSTQSTVIMGKYMIEPCRGTSDQAVYPHSLACRVEGASLVRLNEQHNLSIQLGGLLKFDEAGDLINPSNLRFEIYNCLVPISIPATAGVPSFGFTMATAHDNIKNMLDNFFIPDGNRQMWKIPGFPQPFKILKKTVYHRKGTLLESQSGVTEAVDNTFAPIYHSYNFSKNSNMHYQPTDADAGTAADLKNWKLDSARRQFIPVSYILNKSVANANLTQSAANPAVFSSTVNKAPVLHHRVITKYTDS